MPGCPGWSLRIAEHTDSVRCDSRNFSKKNRTRPTAVKAYREFQVNMRTERVFHQVAFRAFWPALISTLIITAAAQVVRSDYIPMNTCRCASGTGMRLPPYGTCMTTCRGGAFHGFQLLVTTWEYMVGGETCWLPLPTPRPQPHTVLAANTSATVSGPRLEFNLAVAILVEEGRV